MPLLLLAAAGFLLWHVARRKGWPVRKLVLPVTVALIGLVIAAKGRPLVGGAVAAAGIVWAQRERRPARTLESDTDLAWRLAEARALLGLDAGADRGAITAAHRRLMARNHPDVGGTEALARNLNAARDLLLRHIAP